MTPITTHTAPDPAEADQRATTGDTPPSHHAAAPFAPHQPKRLDGWTPERQRGFLERIAEGATVDEATAGVGMSPRAAYALRRRAAGAAFALGWDAAKLVARPIVAEALFCRAMVGQIERITKPDGDVIERHRFDNRLAMSLLARLDRHADEGATTNAAARMIATEFDAFLDLVERDAGPARAGLFLGERLGAETGAGEATMAPLVALARADRWLRSGAGLPSEIAVADLDPAARARWTAEQWARAEAAGLLCLAPAPPSSPAPPKPAPAKPAPASALCALRSDQRRKPAALMDEGREGDEPVWYDPTTEGWRTCFPPPDDYAGAECGEFGEDDYTRECSEEEAIILEAPRDREIAERVVVEGADRDTWFVDYAVDCGLIEDTDAEAVADTDAERLAALAWTFDPSREPDPDEDADDEEAETGGPQTAPQQTGLAQTLRDIPLAGVAAAPNSRNGRSPSVTHLIDGAPP